MSENTYQLLLAFEFSKTKIIIQLLSNILVEPVTLPERMCVLHIYTVLIIRLRNHFLFFAEWNKRKNKVGWWK